MAPGGPRAALEEVVYYETWDVEGSLGRPATVSPTGSGTAAGEVVPGRSPSGTL
jgi:hypothetical protein